MVHNQPVNDLAIGSQGRKSTFLIPAYQPAVADHIGCKDGSHSALNAIRGHSQLPQS